jgi:hypothetical protein
MTISSTTSRVSYTATGGVAFAYTFKILDENDLAVYVDDVLQTITTDYTVSGVGDTGGTVTFEAASTPAAGVTVILIRQVDYTQEADYVEGDDFPAETHEDALDRIVMQIQQLAEQDDRTPMLPITSSITGLELPTPAALAAIGWNATEDGLVNLYSFADPVVAGLTDYARTLLAAATALAARSLLGFPAAIDTSRYAADAEASDTYVITLDPVPAAYYTGMMVWFKANTANTADATLNVNGLGAKAIKKMKDQSLITGDIEAGQLVVVVYDGTNFQMVSQVAAEGVIKTTNGAITFDMASAAGNTSITGLGFTPSLLIVVASSSATASVGFARAAGGRCAGYGDFVIGAGAGSYTAYFASCNDGTSANKFGHWALVTFDADGFTYAYSKTSTPTGNATLAWLAIK